MSSLSPIIPNAGGVKSEDASNVVREYLNYHNDKDKDNSETRKFAYADLVNKYYDLATDFYEWGWGQSFHFAPRYRGENFYASIARHEHWLALKMNIQKGAKVLDIGCGVGGPARTIARFADCHVTGLNNNEYQVQRANLHTKHSHQEHQCQFVKGDFMHLPFEDNSFDAVYQIEATAHAPNKTECYAEILRVLKPGGVFGSYEWCLTKLYDPENAEHRLIKKGIEEGDGLPDIATTDEVIEALKNAGFELLFEEDRALVENETDLPWYHPLEPKYTITNFQHTPLGHSALSKMLGWLEKIKLVKAGSVGVQEFLHTAAVSLVNGGKTGTFTPSFFTLARKPL